MKEGIKELYIEDQKNVRLWKANYTNNEFYNLNSTIKKRLEKIIKYKKNISAREHFMIANIYHHGFTIASSKKALFHIKEAQRLGYKKEKYLLASIADRLLQLQGKPQKYGTQYVELKNGKFKQYKTEKSVTDKERASLGLPKLKELKRLIEK